MGMVMTNADKFVLCDDTRPPDSSMFCHAVLWGYFILVVGRYDVISNCHRFRQETGRTCARAFCHHGTHCRRIAVMLDPPTHTHTHTRRATRPPRAFLPLPCLDHMTDTHSSPLTSHPFHRRRSSPFAVPLRLLIAAALCGLVVDFSDGFGRIRGVQAVFLPGGRLLHRGAHSAGDSAKPSIEAMGRRSVGPGGPRNCASDAAALEGTVWETLRCYFRSGFVL